MFDVTTYHWCGLVSVRVKIRPNATLRNSH